MNQNNLSNQDNEPLLEARGVSVHFTARSSTSRKKQVLKAVDGVSLFLHSGTTLGVVGESGSGKTTLARVLLRLVEPTAGTVRYAGSDVTDLRGERLRSYRRHVQAVFQDPWSSLNPRLRVRQIIADPLRAHRVGSEAERRSRVLELMASVGLDAAFTDRYPNQLSGGQRQRVAVARSLALDPNVIILDEPVSSLDVSIAAQILNLLKDLQARLGLTYLLIAHDLPVVQHMADEIAVMYLGQIVEQGPTDVLVERIRRGVAHPYTVELFEASTSVEDVHIRRKHDVLTGEIPSPLDVPSGCRFHTRCRFAFEPCSTVTPDLHAEPGSGATRCHLLNYSRLEGDSASTTAAVSIQERREAEMAFVPSVSRQAASRDDEEQVVLEVKGLVTRVRTRGTVVHAVDGIDFEVRHGETVGLVGESGSGKSLTALSIVRALPQAAQVVSGEVVLDGEDLLELDESEMRSRIRGKQIAMILQDPLSSLNPAFNVGAQLVESVRLNSDTPRVDRVERAVELFEAVHIPDARGRLKAYPHQFSGGMRQRVVGAIAIAGPPKILIADECTTALDATIQAQYLNLLVELKERTGMSILFITHDLGLVASVCDRVLVMYAGRIVESGEVRDVLVEPRHPYTRGLVNSVPSREHTDSELRTIPGQQSADEFLLPGCRFASRCPSVMDKCRQEYPPQIIHARDGRVACWLYAEPSTQTITVETRNEQEREDP